jgi:hypothetical protein
MIVMPTHVQKSSEIVKTSIRLWRMTFKSVWPFSLLFAFTSIAFNIHLRLGQSIQNIWVSTALYIIISFLSQAAVIDCMNQMVKTDEPYNPSLSMAFKRAFLLLIASIIISSIIAIGSIFLLIPGIILSVSLSFTPYMAIINYNVNESLGESILNDPRVTGRAMKESWSLVFNQWWFTAGRLTIVLIPFLIITLISGSIPILTSNTLINIHSMPMLQLLVGFLSQWRTSIEFIMNTCLYPLAHAAMLTAMYDLQLRKLKK